ncbi:adenylate cyclase, terminal-differentiation specific [Ixodes scapularis]|uniref:adenylate cyclase, terminal-differentiation specific n=1 Tax=Ixodes scapularis TaxID=6945 RepID=UPI00116156C5|nr:adenylate cyclase, terminal-differentiation specific [Ixodes scapularis]
MRWAWSLLLLSLSCGQQMHQQPQQQMQHQHQQMHQQMGVPQIGMPQQGMPQQGMPQPGMPQPGMPQPGMPQQQYAQPQQMQYNAHPQQQQQQGYMQQPQHGHPQQQQGMVAQHNGVPQMAPGGSFIREKAHVQDRAHIQEHLSEMLGPNQDMSKMSEEELQFHYFKLHDNDDNNKLDGLELIKSLIHWHVEESKHLANQGGQQPTPHGTTKLFTDQELANMIDPILDMDDKNRDGFIDYPEFVAAQKSRGF